MIRNVLSVLYIGMSIYGNVECLMAIYRYRIPSRTIFDSRIPSNILDYVKECDMERMCARQNQSGSLGLKAQVITLSSLGNRRAATQILACTLG